MVDRAVEVLKSLITEVTGDTDILRYVVHTRGCKIHVVLGAFSDQH